MVVEFIKRFRFRAFFLSLEFSILLERLESLAIEGMRIDNARNDFVVKIIFLALGIPFSLKH